MDRTKTSGDENDGQLYVWQGYMGKVELISFEIFLTKPVKRVALGEEHSLILTHDDCLFACGSNEHRQLGVPGIGSEYSFDPCLVDAVSGQNISDIACGSYHSACVCNDGQLYLWGTNQDGQCGKNPTEKCITIPALLEITYPQKTCKHGVTSVPLKEEVHRIAGGANHSMALTVRGNVWAWGKGPQLGLGDTNETWKPFLLQRFSGRKVLDIVAGDLHNVVLVEQMKENVKDCSNDDKNLSPGKSEKTKMNISALFEVCAICGADSNAPERGGGMVPKEDACKNGSELSEITHESSNAMTKSVNLETGSNKLIVLEGNVCDNVLEPELDKKAIMKVEMLEKDAEVGIVPEKPENESGIEITPEDPAIIKQSDHDISSLQQNVNSAESFSCRDKSIDDILCANIRNDISAAPSLSCKLEKSISFLDETSAREFLKRQFEDDNEAKLSNLKISLPTEESPVKHMTLSSSSSPYMKQTVTALTNQRSSITTNVSSNIVSATETLNLSTFSATKEESSPKKDTSKAIEISGAPELESRNTININLDDSVSEFVDVSASNISINASQISVADSEASIDSQSSSTSSPLKSSDQSSRKLSVGNESKSIRAVEVQKEILRKRSFSLQAAEVEEKVMDTINYSLDTELWTWGINNKGQLGVGDTVERSEPECVQIMSGRRIVKVACGSNHTLALSSTGEVYSWGLNDSGQLGHNEMSTSPALLELSKDCFVWDLDAGSNHSVFLMDNSHTDGTRPAVFYTGKHPCKDPYVPIYKTSRLSPLKVLKKAGWICSVVTGGDNCACISRHESDMTVAIFEFVRCMWTLHTNLYNVLQNYVKRIEMSGVFTGLNIQLYKNALEILLKLFTELTTKFGVASVELSDILRNGDKLWKASIFTSYDKYLLDLKKYNIAFEEMVAIGGFEHFAKNGSSLFDTLQEFYEDLLKSDKEDKPDHAVKFREIMFMPLFDIKNISHCVMKLSELMEKGSKEQNLLSSVYLNLEHFIKMSSIFIAEADNTNKFWETSANKMADTLKKPSRRLIKENKTNPLTLMNAGRFSSHAFYLFNDLFIHSQSSSFVLHQLETVWVDTPSTESASQQCLIIVTTPEDTLVLNAGTPQNKTEWLVAFNTAINKVLSKQKHISRQNTGDQWGQTPVIRHAFHTFTKHVLFKDATYRGYWMNGKVHGTGFMKWPDGRKYKGKFAHGAICGLGKLVIPKENKTEEVLEGMWKDGNLHGQGKIRYNNGDMYEGCFKDGLRHGHGVYRKGKHLSSASFVYMGEWLFDKKHGYGVMDDILKGEKHMGMWQEDNRHGNGVVVTLDGMYFEGNFQYNKLVGHGLMLTDENSCYEGEFSGITFLQGKGCLTFPNADKIEGTFSGTWNQGLKISGTFFKAMLPSTTEKKSWNKPLETRSSLYGKLCVKPDRKWEEIFYQCYESLHCSGEREPNTVKAWNQVVSSIVSGKQRLRDKDKSLLSSKDKMELSILVQLEKVPVHSVELLTLEHFKEIKQYLSKAFETCAHPLGKVAEDLIDVFRAAYIGIGAHPRLLYHAVQEIHSYIKRIYRVIRVLFPELPASGKPMHVFSDKHHHDCIPITEDTGFLQRQSSETLDDQSFMVVSAPGILQPILLPKIYPALFDLYALHNDMEDEKYWERIQKLNKQGDLSLMAFLGIDQKFWCFDESVLKENKMISSIKDHSYFNAVEILQQISTAFCPYDKLEVIQKTFLSVTETVSGFTCAQQMLSMDDLFPIFQFVVIRAQIHHLGAEIRFIEELMESHLEFGEHGIMFTTLKACYYQIQN